MTTDPTVKRDLPAPTPQHAQSLQPHELEEHRGKISFEVEVILQGYWQSMPSESIKAAMLADWADTLEDWTHEQVVWGLRKWRNENPSRKPNPGHILSILKEQRAKSEFAKMPKDPGEPKETARASKEEADRILKEAGVKVVDGRIVL